MGTPYHSHPYRMDNKIYRLLFPQAPLVRTQKHLEYDFNLCPSGTNAVVAVISYTGYDMEDAMIINKGAYDRGFAHGTVYKSYLRDIHADGAGSSSRSKYRMLSTKKDREKIDLNKLGLDSDGLPHVGTKMEYGQVDQVIYDKILQKAKYSSFKD